MKNIKNLFVTYEIALLLKELGFDEECLCCYTSKSNDNTFDQLWFSDQVWNNSDFHKNPRFCKNTDFGNEKACATPLWQQAVDWFESKGYYINATRAFRWNPRPIEFSGWCVYIGAENPEEEFECNSYFLYHHYSTKIEAQEQAILKCIELCQKK